MAQETLVSIVMPSLNHKRFIEESINSVLNQDYKNIELIIADGKSDDGTIDLLNNIQKQDDRLRWSSQKDTGPAEAINRALLQVRGTLVGWLNSDDLYTDGAIQRAVNFFQQEPNMIMCYGHGEHVDEYGTFINRYPTKFPQGGIDRFKDGCFICQPTVFFKPTMLLLSGYLNDSLKASFDFDLWVRAFKNFPDRIGFIEQVQAQSRWHDGCITKNMHRKITVEGLNLIKEHIGTAPIHWATTYIENEIEEYTSKNVPDIVKNNLIEFIDEIENTISPADYIKVRDMLLRL